MGGPRIFLGKKQREKERWEESGGGAIEEMLHFFLTSETMTNPCCYALLFLFYFNLWVWVFLLHVSLSTTFVLSAGEGQKRALVVSYQDGCELPSR